MPDHTTRQPANGATADNRDRRRDLRQWREFLSAQSHLLAERPGLIFQQAANQPDASAPALKIRKKYFVFPIRKSSDFPGEGCGVMKIHVLCVSVIFS